ncbi:MAG: ABC transporter permease [Planctomycetia bacterium]|nr:ABC transporter permease [Planctomycetia bacterium]
MKSSPGGDSTGLISRLARQHSNELGLLAAIVVVVAITTTFSDAYREKPLQNVQEILRQTALLGVFSLGAAIVIISGGIDLSSGSVIAFSGSVCAAIMLALAPVDDAGNPMTRNLGSGVFAIAIAGTLLTGFLIGTLHAWLITVVGLPPFVATLASLVGLRSLARVFVQEVNSSLTVTGKTTQIYVNDETFNRLGATWWIPLGIFLVLSLLSWVLMSRTVVGRHLYAMGGNEAAARLSGIRTDQLKWLAYCLGAMTASIAGILYTAEVGTANPQVQGRGYELNAIAAAVVGGCSLQGGVGLVSGTMLGVLFLRVVIDSVAKMVKVGADDYEGIIVGFLVVLAVAFNELRQARRGGGKQFFPGRLGATVIGILSLLTGALATIIVGKNAGFALFLISLVGLGLIGFAERRAAARRTAGPDSQLP